MTTVFIKGLGLIGSSLIQAIRRQDPQIKLIGSDQSAKSVEYAVAHHLIDQAATGLDLAAQADFIILATPVSVIEQDLAALAKMTLKPGVIVTDVGSTKQSVLAAAQPLVQRGVTFIGGHPMAGSHKSGVTAGRADLFENAFYFMVPAQEQPAAVQRLQNLLQATHVKWLTVTPRQHDQIVGQLSHLPHVIAAALVNETRETFADSPLGMRLAAGGFKSITRIASSDPTMWTAILATNGQVITEQLTAYEQALSQVNQAIQNHDQATIRAFFQAAKTSRDQLGPENTVQLPNFYDLFLNIPDEVGALAKVTGMLAEANISLVNLHILEIREEIDGVLQLTFNSESARTAAKKLLSTQYSVLQR